MIKKIFSLVIALVMVFSVCSFAFPTSAIYYDEEIVYGDSDNDGVVTLADAFLALRIASGLDAVEDEATLERLDVNFDGAVTLFDARQILRATAEIIRLNPSGAFKGFKGYKDNGINIDDPETAIAVFNAVLNNVKSSRAGFTRRETSEVVNLTIIEANIGGSNLGSATETIGQLVKDKIVSELGSEEEENINKGTNSNEFMSVEGTNYVSDISVNGAYGIDVSYDGGELVTIKVALQDCEIDNLSQSGYANIFNTDIIKEDAESIVDSLFSSEGSDGSMRKEVVNGVATLVFNITNGKVDSYTTTYETRMFVANAKIDAMDFLSAEARGIQYSTRVTVTYDNFKW